MVGSRAESLAGLACPTVASRSPSPSYAARALPVLLCFVPTTDLHWQTVWLELGLTWARGQA